jgi:hypothetical protein
MRMNLITSAAAIALTAALAGTAFAQVNPTEPDKRPAIETEKHGGAERAGQDKRQMTQAEPGKRDEAKPMEAGKPSPRMEEKRAGQAEPADKRMEEKHTGQAEPADKRMEEKHTGQAEPADKRMEEKRTGQAEPADKRMEERKADHAEPADKRLDERKTGRAEPADKRMDEKRTGQAEPADKRIDEKRVDQTPADKRLDDHRRAAGEAEPAPANRHNEANIRVEGNVHVSQERAARVTEEIARIGRPVELNFDVAVGARVPEDILLRPLPPEIVEIAPEYRGYDYVYSNDRIVFIQPDTHEVVGTIVTSGNSVAANDEPRLARPKPCPVD